jgi:hypothetical protein
MPIGCVSCVPHVAGRLGALRARSVLDLGIGMGFYGAVVRQWLDCGVKPWRTKLIGVEAWDKYRNPAWQLYDAVHLEPIERFLDRDLHPPFDGIIMLDVIEHFEKPKGEDVIRRARQRLTAAGQLIIATPGVWMEQGAAYGNEWERHRSLWTAEDFRGLGFEIITDGSPDHFGNQMVLAAAAR